MGQIYVRASSRAKAYLRSATKRGSAALTLKRTLPNYNKLQKQYAGAKLSGRLERATSLRKRQAVIATHVTRSLKISRKGSYSISK